MVGIHNLEYPDEHPLHLLSFADFVYYNSFSPIHEFTTYEHIFGQTPTKPLETLYNHKERITEYVKHLSRLTDKNT